jgi:hypothetical protein
MRTSDVGRLISMFGLVGLTVITVISCGSSGNDSTTDVDASSDAFGGPGFSRDASGGNASSCFPKTCAQLGYNCGPNADGCGGAVDCGKCSGNEQCGIGGYSKCGDPTITPDGGHLCTPKTCADLGYECGVNADGCGGTVDCGSCPSGKQCGIGGFSKCGDPTVTPDGAPACTPQTCASLNYDCGLSGDGCGGQIGPCGTGTCTAPAFCGGGGPNKCGGNSNAPPDGGPTVKCVPTTCANLGYTCGVAGDGCGGSTPSCGTCTSPQFCGGGGANKCGGNNGKGADGGPISVCKPATCSSLGYTCGSAADGCGGIIGPCGPACTAPTVCGGGGKPNQCGSNIPCTGLCQKQVTCDGGGTTTITGIVRAGLQESPGNVLWVPSGTVPDPVPGVLVYIPTTPVQPFDSDPNNPRVQCSQCGADVSGSPLVTATTTVDGKFTLSNVPVSANGTDPIPIVIQLGRWRRQYSFVIPNKCAVNALPQDLNLPSTSTEGDIPLTAISTGSYDPIECVLLKMGVSQSEFTSYTTWNAETASGTAPKPGRVHIYTASQSQASGNGSPGATLAPTVDETALLGPGATASATNGTYMLYDQILLPCWGDAITKSAAELADLGYYGDHGGHFFATHYSYSWLNTNANSNLMSVAQWDPRANTNATPTVNGVDFTGNVSTTVPVTVPVTNPGRFVQWLNYVGALANSNPAAGGGLVPPANPTVTLTAARHDVDKVLNQSVDWIDGTDPNPKTGSPSQMLLHFTFDMPIPTADAGTPTQCGHGIYSDFHVVSSSQSNGKTFPAECDKLALNSQERILEYMIWDLASCVPGPPISTCTPKTCAAYPAGTCGQQTDGCNGLTANCGTCAPGLTCGGGGTPAVCGAPDGGACTPLTCASYAAGTCGQQSDGCGGVTPDCNPCPQGQTCGGGGVNGQCGSPPGSSCTPMTCAQQNIACGPAGDGCGNIIPSCGSCPTSQSCGGGGVPGQCGETNTCVPLTCAQQNIACGPAGDGCGNLIASCGTCVPPASCGGGGTPGQCGSGPPCVPKTCQELNTNCGPAGDGCGNLIPTCGTCAPPATCGGGGTAGQCGAPISK